MAESEVAFLGDFPTAAFLVKALLLPGILGTAVLAVAMWYFWYSVDQSNWVKKLLWFLILFLGLMLGPLVYYLFAYRRHPALDSWDEKNSRTASS